MVIFLHREKISTSYDREIPDDIKTDVIIAKQRNGPVGTIQLAFIPEYTKFETLAKPSENP